MSSFASGLERFYEFSLRVFLENSSMPDALFQSSWKNVASHSEHHLGAFVFWWASSFNELPELLSNAQVCFRNDVIHKGKIPTNDEAAKYGNSVFRVLRPKMLAVQERFPGYASKVAFKHLRDCRSDSDNGKLISTVSIPTIANLTPGEQSHCGKSLENHLLRLAEWRKRTRAS